MIRKTSLTQTTEEGRILTMLEGSTRQFTIVTTKVSKQTFLLYNVAYVDRTEKFY